MLDRKWRLWMASWMVVEKAALWEINTEQEYHEEKKQPAASSR